MITVHTVLSAVDPLAAMALEASLQALAGPLRVGLVALDPERARRQLAALPDELRDLVHVRGADHLGLADLHALVLVTPCLAPLGASERALLDEALAQAGPTAQALLLADLPALDQVSDDPAAELAAISARLQGLLPAGTLLLTELAPQLYAWRTARDTLAASRSRAVVQAASQRAQARAHEAQQAAFAQIAELEQLLAEHAEQRAVLRAQHARVIRRAIALVRKEAERLHTETHAFMVALEAALPAEIDALADKAGEAQVERLLPGWLAFVMQAQLHDSATRFDQAITEGLSRLDLPDKAVSRPRTVIPMLHPGAVHGPRDWRGPLGTLAGVAGGAALALVGLWGPALVAAGSGVAWSAAHRQSAGEAARDGLVLAARASLRELHERTDELFRAQRAELDAALHALDAPDADLAADAALREQLSSAQAAQETAMVTLATLRALH